MDKIPAALWALMLALMGAMLAVLVLFHPAEQTTTQAVLTIASSLVSGALGAFAGHAAGSSTKADVTTGNAPTTINVSDSK